MRVIIVGCGRVGSALTIRLAGEGHDVRVIDRDPESGDLPPAHSSGRFIQGNGFNRRVLAAAGIDQADAFVAVTSGDNSNIVAARIAKEVYRVPLVIARIYDPRRASIYRDLGIPTVASVVWTVNAIHRTLTHRHLSPEQTYGNGETVLLKSSLPAYLAGRPLLSTEVPGQIRIVEVTRAGRSLIPDTSTVAVGGDLVTFAVATSALDTLRSFLDKDLGT